MCIERVTAWAFAGRNYSSELEAVRAAIDEIGKRVVKDHAANPGKGLVEQTDLPKLLLRHAELTAAEGFDPFDSSEGTRDGEPEGTRETEHAPADAGMIHP